MYKKQVGGMFDLWNICKNGLNKLLVATNTL